MGELCEHCREPLSSRMIFWIMKHISTEHDASIFGSFLARLKRLATRKGILGDFLVGSVLA